MKDPAAIKAMFLILFSFLEMNSNGQKIASIEVELKNTNYKLDIPVSINLDELTYISDTLICLYEVNGSVKVPIPFQIEPGNPRKLFWLVKTGNGSANKHLFELDRGKVNHFSMVTASTDDGAITIHKDEKNFLRYYFRTVYPPSGWDTAYRKSGFIHPLWSPNGQVLTRIQPPDEKHHYGIWNPWTHVLFEGDTIDFWNLGEKQGTVRFAKFVSIENGPVFSGFDALHEHVAFKKHGGEKVALNELQSVRVFPLSTTKNFFIVDFNIHLNCASESPFRIMKYRYEGFGWRTTEKWDRNNSMVLTSEGKNRKEADNTKARWLIVQGEIDNDYAGAVMMCFPTNYNFPEPLRIWPENQLGRGDMFASFSTTRDTEWLLIPGQNYVLKYRLLVFNGHMDKETAENAWQYFAYPPKIRIKIVE